MFLCSWHCSRRVGLEVQTLGNSQGSIVDVVYSRSGCLDSTYCKQANFVSNRYLGVAMTRLGLRQRYPASESLTPLPMHWQWTEGEN